MTFGAFEKLHHVVEGLIICQVPFIDGKKKNRSKLYLFGDFTLPRRVSQPTKKTAPHSIFLQFWEFLVTFLEKQTKLICMLKMIPIFKYTLKWPRQATFFVYLSVLNNLQMITKNSNAQQVT